MSDDERPIVDGGEHGDEDRRPPDADTPDGPWRGADIDRLRERADREVALRAERIRDLSEQLRAANRELTRKTRELERTKDQLQRTKKDLANLRKRRVVRVGLALAGYARWGLGVIRRVRGEQQATRSEPPARQHRLRATRAEETALRERLLRTPANDVVTGPLVSIVVVTRDGAEHLRKLVPAIGELSYRDIELIVVDNASTDDTVPYLRDVSTRFPVTVVENAVNAPFGDANDQGAARATGRYVLFLNNDVLPVRPDVLGAMVARLDEDQSIAAVGSRLIYPRRRGPELGPKSKAPDLTLQHRGIGFELRGGEVRPRNLGTGEDPTGPDATSPAELPAATAACILLRKDAFDAVGGFTTGYVYGLEDVDLCLKLRERGSRIVYEPSAMFWHHESATQHLEAFEERAVRQEANRALFTGIWGPRLYREVLLDRLASERARSDQPLRIGITLTRNDVTAGWGDYYTAHELGEAFGALGWDVIYLERWKDHWYDGDPPFDVLVALLDSIDVRRLPAEVIKVAWVRNWTDRWLGHPWFDEYDIVFASSDRSKRLIDEGSSQVAELMPLATNTARFTPGSETRDDVVFVGNYWGVARGIAEVVERLAANGVTPKVYGKGWEEVPSVAPYAHGVLAYEDIPAVYARSAIVLDDTAGPTLPYAAVNARVFDALAAGSLVVTDNTAGAQEIFAEAGLPAGEGAEDMVNTVVRFLAAPDERIATVERLRSIVTERHTYGLRAEQFRAALQRWVTARRIDIAIGPPSWDVAPSWGDYHFGRALQRALQQTQRPTRIRLLADWDRPAAAYSDAVIHLYGRSERRRRPSQVNVLWIISHPGSVTDDLLRDQDVIFAASDPFAAELAARIGRPVMPLHQATDPDRFRPREGGEPHELLFVANSRGERRRIIDELTPTDRDLAVYGKAWYPELLDRRYHFGEYIANEELAAYYSAASIVLNDHWPDMAEHGLLSNRLYDASAAGAFVISDHVPGIEEEFDDGIVTFRTGAELRHAVDRYLADPEGRDERARRARTAVIERHTFAQRATRILAALDDVLADRPAAISGEPRDAREATAAIAHMEAR